MEIKYFENGFVGKEVYDANEAIMCFNAGMNVSSEIGDFLYENMEGNLPDDSEVISRIIESIQEFGKVYVGFYLEGKKVVDIKTTTLSSNFEIGQTIYFMFDGGICSAVVKCISMSTNKISGTLCKDYRSYIETCLKDVWSYVSSKLKDIETLASGNCACVYRSNPGRYHILPLDKVFPTKEALVQDLLSKSK